MTEVIISMEKGGFFHMTSSKSPDEIYREVELGVFEMPVQMKAPTAVRLRNNVLIAERETNPLISKNQLNILELMSQGACEGQIETSLHLSPGGVRHHLESLKKKFNVTTREELIAAYSRLYR